MLDKYHSVSQVQDMHNVLNAQLRLPQEKIKKVNEDLLADRRLKVHETADTSSFALVPSSDQVIMTKRPAQWLSRFFQATMVRHLQEAFGVV